MDNLNVKIKSGLKWNIINEIVSKVVFVGFSFYLARILGPEVYGLLVILTIFSGLATMLVDFGFSSSIVYFKDLSHEKKSTIFWMNIFISIVLYLLFVLLAPNISDFYNNPKLTLYIRVLMLVLLFSGSGAVHSAILSKEINFKLKTIFSWVATILSFIAAFTMIYFNFTIESLIAQILVFNFFNTVFLWHITKWTPLLHFSTTDLKEVFGYSSKILYSNFLNYFASNSDNFIISKILGDTSVGIYNRAFTTVAMPITSVSGIFNKVFFPVFSILNDDMPRFRSYYLKTISLISFIMFPIMIGLYIITEEFVHLILGEAWLEIIPIMQLFCLMGLVRALLFVNGIIYNSTGNTKMAIYILLITNIIFIVMWIITLSFYDLNTMMLVFCIVQFLIAYPLFKITFSIIELPFIDMFKQLVRPLIGALLFFVVYYFFEHYVESLPLIIVLGLKMFLCFLIYTIYTYFFQKKQIITIRNFLK
jgi:PST family polysaccharide transporter